MVLQISHFPINPKVDVLNGVEVLHVDTHNLPSNHVQSHAQEYSAKMETQKNHST